MASARWQHTYSFHVYIYLIYTLDGGLPFDKKSVFIKAFEHNSSYFFATLRRRILKLFAGAGFTPRNRCYMMAGGHATLLSLYSR